MKPRKSDSPLATEKFKASDFFFDSDEADAHARKGPLGSFLTPEEIADVNAQVHEAGRKLAEAIAAGEAEDEAERLARGG